MQTAAPGFSFRSDVAVLSAFAALLVVVHFALGNGYGFHRDELQFLDDARHLQWGFVAYPPLTAFCGRVAIALFGISPQVFRLPAAVVNAVSLVLTGLIARELGARRAAQVVALFAALPLALAFSSVLQYNTFDLLSWCVIVFFTARVLRTGDERNWMGVGVGVGLGVLSKYSIAFCVVSLLVALIAMPSQRGHLRSRWFWYGAATAAVIAAPNLVWLAGHHFITLRMESFIHARDVRIGRAQGYFRNQLRLTMLALPLVAAGLFWLLRSGRFRLLGAFYLGPLVLFALARGRAYYLLPAYPVLYAAGSVALQTWLDRWSRPWRVVGRGVVIAAMLVDAGAVAWTYLPIWKAWSPEWKRQVAANSDLADEVGWPEFVAQVAAVRDLIPVPERAGLAVLANNYGEAGALALYGPQYGLPVPISSTNTFHLRGYGPHEPVTVIVVGDSLGNQMRNFEICAGGGAGSHSRWGAERGIGGTPGDPGLPTPSGVVAGGLE